jgi:hypothetical protein
MIKYLIFNKSQDSVKTNVPGSAQAVACEIARTVEMMGNTANDFIAYPADSSEATFEVLKALPLFSVELDQQKIDLWVNHGEPILEKINSVHAALEDAYSLIMGAIRDLRSECENTEVFSGLNLIREKEIDRAFEYIENPSDDVFADKVSELFDVKSFEVTR